jgi:hypothetical protein
MVVYDYHYSSDEKHILTSSPLSQHLGDSYNLYPQSIHELFNCCDNNELKQIAEYCRKTLYYHTITTIVLNICRCVCVCMHGWEGDTNAQCWKNEVLTDLLQQCYHKLYFISKVFAKFSFHWKINFINTSLKPNFEYTAEPQNITLIVSFFNLRTPLVNPGYGLKWEILVTVDQKMLAIILSWWVEKNCQIKKMP